jgi:hypothetical protein
MGRRNRRYEFEGLEPKISLTTTAAAVVGDPPAPTQPGDPKPVTSPATPAPGTGTDPAPAPGDGTPPVDAPSVPGGPASPTS